MTKFELLPEFGQGGSQARQILYITSQAEEAKQTSEFFAARAPFLHLQYAGNCREALMMLAPGQDFDILLVNRKIPDCDTFTLIQEIQQRCTNLPIILIAPEFDEEVAICASQIGIIDYIFKHEHYLTHLLFSIIRTLKISPLSQTIDSLRSEIDTLNVSLEQKVEARTAEIRAAQNKLQATLDAVPDLLFEADLNGRYFDYHSPRTELLAAPPEQILGKTVSDILPPDAAKVCLQALQDANKNSHSQGKQFPLHLPLGTRWFELSISRKQVEMGQEPRFIVLSRDITERKIQESQLALAAKVFEQSKEGFVITDANKKIIKVNQAFTAITGYSETEALGQNPRILSSGRHNRDFFDAIWETIETENYWQGEIWNRRKDGHAYPEWLSISKVLDANGEVTHYIGIFSDITAHKVAEAHIRKLAHFDSLTGLPNRTLLADRVNHTICAAQRNQETFALLFIDLDRFKQVNDLLGHRIGDAMLVQLAERLKTTVREQDTVARLGGDEFIIVLPGTDASGAAHVAEKLLELVAQPYFIEPHELIITPSIGVAMHPDDGKDLETLSKCADTAMYRAKKSGRNNFCFYTPEMQAQSERALFLESALRQASGHQQLKLHYQPLISLQSGKIVGAEALVRWHHPELGNIAATDFIPIAEDTGQILQIGEWVLRTALNQLKQWQLSGLAPLTMSINLSAVQFRHPELLDLVSKILAELKLPAHTLTLELTERGAMDNPHHSIGILKELHELGVSLTIDDFGTGYSSLSYLKRFQVNQLKIDQSFIQDSTRNTEDAAVICAIINLAKGMGLKTIAVGVETAEQAAFLGQHGCDEVQGFFFSKPLSAEEFERFARKPELVN